MPPDEESVWRARDAVLNDWNEAGAFIRAELPHHQPTSSEKLRLKNSRMVKCCAAGENRSGFLDHVLDPFLEIK